MNITDRNIKRLLRENPARINPKHKQDIIGFIAETYGTDQTEKSNQREGIYMKKRNLRFAVIIAAVALSLSMLVSAALVGYYYTIPGGNIVDQDGNTADESGKIDTKTNDRVIHGDGWSIAAVTWTAVSGRTTLAVWATTDSAELIGLRAVIDGVEYPLEKTTFSMNRFIGYTTVNIPEPAALTLLCNSPEIHAEVNFQPEDVIPAESYSNGFTLFGTISGNTLYLGLNDEVFFEQELFQNAELGFVKTIMETVTDNEGNVCPGTSGGTNRDEIFITRQHFDLPEKNRIVSVKTNQIQVIYNYFDELTAPGTILPIPADGETITGTWDIINSDGFRYTVNRIRRTDNSIFLLSEDDLTYETTDERPYSVATEQSYIYLGVNGHDVVSSSGTGKECEIIFDAGELESFAEHGGGLPVFAMEIAIIFEGNWELNFE